MLIALYATMVYISKSDGSTVTAAVQLQKNITVQSR